MRDYKSISAEDFLAESLKMNMRWLAQQLRRIDSTAEIEKWGKSVNDIEDFEEVKGFRENLTEQLSARTQPSLRKRWTISVPSCINSINKVDERCNKRGY